MASKEKELYDDETPEEKPKAKSNHLLLVIIIAVVTLVLMIVGIVAYILLSNTDTHAPQNSSPQASQAPTNLQNSTSTEIGIMYPLDLFTVNLISETGRRYLKVEMSLELDGEELIAELDTKTPLLRDIIIRVLSSKSIEEISTIKGKETIKEQIVSEINTRIKDGKIKNVYFVDFVVQ